MAIVTADEVRDITGAPTDLIDDTTINNLIGSVEDKTKAKFNIVFTPKTKIETLTGEYKDKILLDEYFPLTAYKVVNGSTEIDLENIYVHTKEGFLEIYGESVTGGGAYPYSGQRFSQYDLDVKVKYLYGAVERDTDNQTEISVALTAGNAVSIEVADSSIFSDNDYAFIEDTNRAKEVFKITSVDDTTHITAEKLVNDYESGALVSKAKTMELFKQFVLYETGLAVGTSAVGSTYTFNTSYSLGALSTNKGVPYPHWEKNTQLCKQRRDELLERINMLLATII